jgi:phosphatidate phosphatase APP1
MNLEIQFNDDSHQITTNKRGVFNLSVACVKGNAPDLSQLHVYLLDNKKKIKLEVPEPFNHCFFSFQDKNTAVISDIDDTVLVTHTLNTFKKIRTLLVKNALKRKSVKAMRTFYQQFSEEGFPFFYVSNSETNLFPMIRLFLEHNKFPVGPIFLKSFVKWNQIYKRRKQSNKGMHKREKIEFLIKAFPNFNFILIGDDSQQDPEIYTEFAQTYSKRISEIYIRNVKKSISKKRLLLKSQIEKIHKTKVVYFKNPEEIISTIKN